nr:hypothetical protein [Tanacetum cinerariifolium]
MRQAPTGHVSQFGNAVRTEKIGTGVIATHDNPW